jgi:transcriptional regulator with XRE-family HTH domain
MRNRDAAKWYVKVGQEVRAQRKERGIGQQLLARKVGLSQAQVSRLEAGLQGFRFVVLAKVCGVIGIKPSSVLANVGL